MRRWFFLLLVAAVITGCGSYPALRDGNREKMSKLDSGMSRDQVVAIMGNDGFGDISNPYKRDSFLLGSDKYEVLYYYTDFIKMDQPMDTGMTPIIIKNGSLVGTGKEFLSKVK